MITITKAVRFCAAHRYWRSEWSDEKNHAVFGKCVNLHGHNYRLEVTIRGTPDKQTGMIMDLKNVKNILKNTVLETFDHHYINEKIPHFRRIIPTTENLVLYIRELLKDAFENAAIHRIRLWEDIDLYSEWREDA